MKLLDAIAARFKDRQIPSELPALLAVPRGADDPLYEVEFDFLDPDEVDPLHDTSYMSAEELARPDIAANVAATAELSKYLVLVVRDGDGNHYGYWLGVDEPETTPVVVCWDSEGQFSVERGSLVEALIAEAARYYDHPDDVPDEVDPQELAFARLRRAFVDAGVPVAARSLDELAKPVVNTHPQELQHRLYEAEFDKRA